MKKFLTVSALAVGLMGAAPAAEASGDFFGEILAQILVSNMGNNWHGPAPHSWSRHQPHHASAPLAPIVRDFERRTGGRVTDVRLSRDGRYYILRGVDRRGRPVETRAALPQRHAGHHRGWRNNGPAHIRQQTRPFTHWRPGLERQRYSGFSHVVSRGDYYDVRARDARGRPVALQVCSKTGKVLRSRYY